MIFADGQWWALAGWSDRDLAVAGFWFGVGGTVVAVGSVWFSWWLAKRDISARIAKATAETRAVLTRVASGLLHSEVRELAALLTETRVASERRDWATAVDRCRSSANRLAKLRDDPRLSAFERQVLIDSIDNLRLTVTYLERRSQGPPAGDAAVLTPAKKKVLDDLIATLYALEGRLTRDSLQVSDEPR